MFGDMNICNSLRSRLLLSLQIALLGNVGGNIRAISCGVFANVIRVIVVFDGVISDSDREAMDEVGSEVASHFSEESIMVECVRMDAPQKIDDVVLDWYAYRRKE